MLSTSENLKAEGSDPFIEKVKEYLNNPEETSLCGNCIIEFNKFLECLGEHSLNPIDPQDMSGTTTRGFILSEEYGDFVFVNREHSDQTDFEYLIRHLPTTDDN